MPARPAAQANPAGHSVRQTPISRYFALVPAAGTGSRVGADRPKQYLSIGARTILRISVEALAAQPWIEAVLVVVAPDDLRAQAELKDLPGVHVVQAGGATRAESVLGGLRALQSRTWPGGERIEPLLEHDWVMVHDAARPGVTGHDLRRLRDELIDDPVGGILALPVADTVKRSEPLHPGQGGAPQVAQTLSREGLWLAQTPQMFRYGRLLAALSAHSAVTDEAGAIEASGLKPRLVAGSLSNFKVTTAADLALMRRLLAGFTQTDEEDPS